MPYEGFWVGKALYVSIIEQLTALGTSDLGPELAAQIRPDGHFYTLQTGLWCVRAGRGYGEAWKLSNGLGLGTDDTVSVAAQMAGWKSLVRYHDISCVHGSLIALSKAEKSIC